MSAKDAGPRLGRGLAALLGESGPAPEAASSASAPVTRLEPGPFQPRVGMDEDALAELTDSVRQRGVLQPILVRPHPSAAGQYQIIAGERRWRAAQRAGLHEVPVFVRTLSDADAMAAALIENLQREDLDPIEEAEGYRRLVDEFALTADQLGTAIGKSRSHVANTLRLLNLPESVRAAVRKRDLSAGHARALLSHPDPEKAAVAVVARGLNVRQTEALARQPTSPIREAPVETRQDPDTAALERQLAEHLGLRINITSKGTGGVLRLHFRTLDQLDGLVSLLTRS